jgi:hypothetical protein
VSIFRHTIKVTDPDVQTLQLTGPPISVATDRGGQSDRFDMWYEEAWDDPRPVTIYVFGTGHPTPWTGHTRHAYRFLGTVLTPLGLVWHVYVGPNPGQPVAV